MTDIEPSVYSELKRNRFSGIPKLNEEDVAGIWASVSHFVEKQMLNQRGVNINGLGTFTFSQRSLEVGNGKQMMVQRPVFQLAEKFAQTHALNYTKHYLTGQIPIVTLNFTSIASETPYPRATVETCIRELLQALSRSLNVKKNIEFIFSGIGCLSIRDARVKMRFFKDFVTNLDSSGELVNALRNRPDTSDSVYTNILTPRPTTGNTVILPRVNLDPGNTTEEHDALTTIDQNLMKNCKTCGPMKNLNAMPTIAESDESQQRQATPQIPRSPKPTTPNLGEIRSLTDPIICPVSPSSRNRLRQLSHISRNGSGLRSLKPTTKKELSTPPTPGEVPNTTPRNDNQEVKETDKTVKLQTSRPDTGCGHNAGQELCYLCHQRVQKNIPLRFLNEERRQKEAEEEELLHQYQDKKDLHAILQQQAKNFQNRKINQQIAAFNLGISEAIKEKKTDRATSFNRSYLFQHRPATPPQYLRQALYSEELAKQVKENDRMLQQQKADRDFLERLEQVQLAEDLARQREQYLQEERSGKEAYSQALKTQQQHNLQLQPSLLNRSCLHQMTLPKPNIISPFEQVLVSNFGRKLDSATKTVQFKPLPIPAAEPDSVGPIFGVHDGTPEKMRRQRERARKLYKDQLAMVADKKRAAILRDLTTQREESEMLEQTKKALLLERDETFKESMEMRRALEKSWNETHRRKLQREHEESLKTQTPGVLIQEQCDKYHRCNQCGRRPWNCGESNIWRESRYISGSRLIV